MTASSELGSATVTVRRCSSRVVSPPQVAGTPCSRIARETSSQPRPSVGASMTVMLTARRLARRVEDERAAVRRGQPHPRTALQDVERAAERRDQLLRALARQRDLAARRRRRVEGDAELAAGDLVGALDRAALVAGHAQAAVVAERDGEVGAVDAALRADHL